MNSIITSFNFLCLQQYPSFRLLPSLPKSYPYIDNHNFVPISFIILFPITSFPISSFYFLSLIPSHQHLLALIPILISGISSLPIIILYGLCLFINLGQLCRFSCFFLILLFCIFLPFRLYLIIRIYDARCHSLIQFIFVFLAADCFYFLLTQSELVILQ